MSLENADQKAFWERFSALWVAHQAALDTLFAPVLDGVLERAGLEQGQSVLDIGCGTGTSTTSAAKSVGPAGRVDGVDISEPMLAQARSLAKGVANVRFETADAADHPFVVAGYDAVISRFGVMFFADPIKAFANIRRGMKPGTTLTMACWSTLDANPWFQIPMYAAKKQLGAPPPLDPDAPGPLAFRDIDKVSGILTAAGYSAVRGDAVALELTPPGDLTEASEYASSIGPAARTMEYFEGTEADFRAITLEVAKAFEGYLTPEGVRVPAKINFFSATAA